MHYQQLIRELFEHILRGWESSGDTDMAFRSQVQDKLAKLDDGVHVGSWGQLQEWKLDIDVQNDTHRHLSHLVGWYPGFSVSGIYGFNKTVTDAVTTTLYSRGTGVEDQNTGWGKVWRSACWARLNNTDEAYYEVKLAIQNNFAGNGLDLYNGGVPFQIDANFGLPAAMLAMLIRDLDRASDDMRPQAVLLGPAIPASWGGGSVSGMRLRGGGTVDFTWDSTGTVTSCRVDKTGRGRNAPALTFFVKGGRAISC